MVYILYIFNDNRGKRIIELVVLIRSRLHGYNITFLFLFFVFFSRKRSNKNSILLYILYVILYTRTWKTCTPVL